MRELLIIIYALFFSIFAEPRIHGFFVQPSLDYGGIDYDNSTFGNQEQWNSWVKSMADVGAKYLVYQWSARYEYDQTWYSDYWGEPAGGDAAFTYYDASSFSVDNISSEPWAKATTWPNKDTLPIERTLLACDANNMKLWVGLYINEGDNSDPSKNFNWWTAIADNNITQSDSATIEHHLNMSFKIIDDISAKYGNDSAFAGFYFTIEISNVAFMPQKNHAYLANILDRLAKYAHTKAPGCRVALSPFFNTIISGIPCADTTEFEAMWSYALSNSDFDIIILQDGAGVDPFSLSDTSDYISPYYRGLKRAAKAGGKKLWANSELFTQDAGGTRLSPKFIPSSINRISRQLQTESSFVDTFVCFGFHYMDPNLLHKFSGGYLGTLNNEAQLRKSLYDDYKEFYDSISLSPIKKYLNENTSDYGIIKTNSSLFIDSRLHSSLYRIYTTNGRIIKNGRVPESGLINVSTLPVGVYWYELTTPDRKIRRRFIVR